MRPSSRPTRGATSLPRSSRSDPAGRTATGPFHPEQSLPVERAVRAACLDPAITAGRDDLGRLLPGAIADLLVVPVEGLLDPGERGERLAATRPLATLIDGEVVPPRDGATTRTPESALTAQPRLRSTARRHPRDQPLPLALGHRGLEAPVEPPGGCDLVGP